MKKIKDFIKDYYDMISDRGEEIYDRKIPFWLVFLVGILVLVCACILTLPVWIWDRVSSDRQIEDLEEEA